MKLLGKETKLLNLEKEKLVKWLMQEKIFFYLILLLGSFLRFYKYNSWSFSNDELSALSVIKFSSVRELLFEGVKFDGHPAITQLFEYFWLNVFDASTIRLPFVLFGILSIHYAYKTASLWIGKFPALFVAAVISVSEFFVLYSQIARPYSMGCFFVLLFSYYWTLHIQGKRSIKISIGFILGAALSIMTHYFATLTIFIILLIGFFHCERKQIKSYFIHILITAVLCFPHLPISLYQLSIGGVGAWLPIPEPNFIVRFLDYGSNDFIFLQAAILLAALVPLILPTKSNKRSKWKISAISIFVLSYFIAYFYSTEVNAVLQFSTLIFTFPFFIIFVFSIADYQKRKKLGLIFIFLILALGTYALVVKNKFYESKRFANFKGVAKNLEHYTDSLGGENLLIFMNSHNPFYFEYYFNQMNFHPDITMETITGYEDFAAIHKLIENTDKNYIAIAWANDFMPYEVHEIIKRNFPERIIHHHYFNSEFSIYKKEASNRETLFEKLHSIEEEIANWEVDWSNKDSSTYVSPKHSLHIDSTSLYSLTYRSTVENIFKENSRFLTIELYALMDTISDCQIVVSVNQNDIQIDWKSYNIQDFYRKSQWFHPLFVYEKRKEFKATDAVTIYIWNPHKNNFWIDDFSLKVFADSDYDYYDLHLDED